MKIENYFDSSDDKMTQRITEDYPTLSNEEKERIYALIQQKQGEGDFVGRITVSGVEQYKRPWIHSVVSVAAAAAAVIGIGTTTHLLHRSEPYSPDSSVCTLKNADRMAVAVELTNEFLKAANIITGGACTVSTEGRIYVYDYSSRNPAWNGDDILFVKVTDPDFQNSADLLDLVSDIVTDEYMVELEDSGGDFFRFGLEAMTGGEYSSAAPSYIEFSGSLYAAITGEHSPAEYTALPAVTISDNNSFTAVRSTDTEYSFRIVWDGQQWKINDIERSNT